MPEGYGHERQQPHPVGHSSLVVPADDISSEGQQLNGPDALKSVLEI